MKDDIRPTSHKHEHKWFFLTTKNSFDPVKIPAALNLPDLSSNVGLYNMVEYAYLICNACTTVIKRKVLTKEEVDREQ